MEEFNYTQISIDLQIKQSSGLALSNFSIKIVKDNSLTVFQHPFPVIYLTSVTESNTTFSLHYEEHQAAYLESSSNFLVPEKTQSFSMSIVSSFTSKIDSVSISMQQKKFDSFQISEELIKKYKEDLQDTSKLIRILSESSESVIFTDTNPNAYQDLAVDLNLLSSAKPITNQQSETLKDLVLGLNQKLKVLSSVEKILEATTQNYVKTLAVCEVAHETHTELLRKTSKIESQYQQELKKLHELNDSTRIKLENCEKNNRDLKITVDELNGKIFILSSEKEKLESRLKNFEILEENIRMLQKNIEDLEKSREKLNETFVEFQKSCEGLNKTKDTEFLEVTSKNTELEEILRSKVSEIFELKTLVSDKDSVISKQNSEIASYLSEINGYKDQESRLFSIEALSKKHHEECLKSNEKIQNITAKFSEVLKEINLEKQKLLKTNADLMLKTTDQDDKTHILEKKLIQEQLIFKDIKSENDKLKSSTILNENSQSISFSLLKLYSDFSKSKSKFTSDFEVIFKGFTSASSEHVSSLKHIGKLREILLDKNEENLILKQINLELQRKLPYIGVKDDAVDLAMADYVNSLLNPLEIPFIREEPGIYFFGTKKIYVKLDNGRLSGN